MSSNNFIDSRDLSYMETLGLTVKAEFENPHIGPFIDYFTTMKEYLEFREEATSAGSEFIESAWLGYVIRKSYKNGNSYILVKGGYVSNPSDFIIFEDTYSTHRAAKGVATRYHKQDVADKRSDVSDYTVLRVVNGHILK